MLCANSDDFTLPIFELGPEVGVEPEVVVAVVPAFQVWPLPKVSPQGPLLPPCLAGADRANGEVVTLTEISKNECRSQTASHRSIWPQLECRGARTLALLELYSYVHRAEIEYNLVSGRTRIHITYKLRDVGAYRRYKFIIAASIRGFEPRELRWCLRTD